MKKIILLVLMVMSINLVSAYVDGMTVELKSPVISTNDTTYVSVFLLDENQQQIVGANPIIKSTPSYPVDIKGFVGCDTAEGRELCGKMDNTLVGLGGAYVSEINSKDIDEDVILTVYSDSTENAKVFSRDLKIGKGADVEKAVTTIEEVPKVGGDNIKGLNYIILALLLTLVGFGFAIKTLKEEK